MGSASDGASASSGLRALGSSAEPGRGAPRSRPRGPPVRVPAEGPPPRGPGPPRARPPRPQEGDLHHGTDLDHPSAGVAAGEGGREVTGQAVHRTCSRGRCPGASREHLGSEGIRDPPGSCRWPGRWAPPPRPVPGSSLRARFPSFLPLSRRASSGRIAPATFLSSDHAMRKKMILPSIVTPGS